MHHSGSDSVLQRWHLLGPQLHSVWLRIVFIRYLQQQLHHLMLCLCRWILHAVFGFPDMHSLPCWDIFHCTGSH